MEQQFRIYKEVNAKHEHSLPVPQTQWQNEKRKHGNQKRFYINYFHFKGSLGVEFTPC